MSTKSVQRKIDGSDLEFPGYLRAPHEAKPTAIGLWTKATDGLGRCELVPELIAAAIYPGEAATDRVVEHLLMLDESGFLTIYPADGSEWIALTRPLKLDARLAWSNCPTPPREDSRTFAAVGGARAGERARELVRAEDAARADAWEAVRRDREGPPTPPVRPFLLDAPPMFCPDHMPGGAGKDGCGPCRDARIIREDWLTRRVYTERVTKYAERMDEREARDERD